MEKQDLSPVVKELLCRQYGSLTGAVQRLNVITYQGLLRSLRLNSFPVDFLTVVFPDQSLEVLFERYNFRIGRQNKKDKEAFVSRTSPISEFIGEEDLRFLRENKKALERVIKLIGEECARMRALFE